MTVYRKKLIEVALPLEAINEASAREKSIRHGHPSTLHLWWARRPLAAARAVIFAQMVDDPSDLPDLFPTEREQEKERQRLFRIIEDLVKWENTTNEIVLQRARDEIWKSWRRACAENSDHPRAKELFNRDVLPAFHDPFAGGGSLPLEAQRLGLEAHASDLNPVAVLINKAMIEIPPKFAGRPPVNPDAHNDRGFIGREWRGAQGLAQDLRYYGAWMRAEAEKRIGHLYPKVEITQEVVAELPDLRLDIGKKFTVIVWLWARTVRSPDPSMAGVHVPLIASYWLSKKPKKLSWLEPLVSRSERTWSFKIRSGKASDETSISAGTKTGRGTFKCILSGVPITPKYIQEEGKNGRIGHRLIAIVGASENGRAYFPAVSEHESIAQQASPSWKPSTPLGDNTRHLTPVAYGYVSHDKLFTPRQLVALDTLTSLVAEARTVALADAQAAGRVGWPSSADVGAETLAYADSIAALLAIAVSRRHDRWTAFSIWHTVGEKLESLIRLSAIPMTWEFAEGNPFSDSTGNFLDGVELTAKAIEHLGFGLPGIVVQADARQVGEGRVAVVTTDPPYFDNIPYADLSDLFYVWLRRALLPILPDLVSTVLVPKVDELVADPARHGGRDEAERFFFDGMRKVISGLKKRTFPGIPVAIFYAFKQSESESSGVVSTGWDSFLSAVVEGGFSIEGTWPIRTEQSGGLRNVGRNSLATSVVLVCRPRSGTAPIATRREFVNALQAKLPSALGHLQRSNIMPVDLAQAAIGPGMAIFTSYSSVLDAQGQPLAVRDALALINRSLDEALVEQEGDFDADSRWALAWFEQYGFAEGEFGVAETLSRAKNTSVRGMEEAGIILAKPGKVRLLKPSELSEDWEPARDARLTHWEAVHQLIRALENGGETTAATLVSRLGPAAETARELAYHLYSVCERKKRSQEGLSYNALVQSWPEIQRLAQAGTPAGVGPEQMELV